MKGLLNLFSSSSYSAAKVETERQPVDLNYEIEQIRLILERTIPKMVRT